MCGITLNVFVTCLLCGSVIISESFHTSYNHLNESATNETIQTHNVAIIDDFVQIPSNKQFPGGSQLHLKCIDNEAALSTGISHISWFRNYMRIADNSFIHNLGEDLIISVTTGDDIGIYTCDRGFNTISSFNVSLKEPYFLHRLPKFVTTYTHSDVELECNLYFSTPISSSKKVENNTDWSVIWLHENRVISNKWEICNHNGNFSCGEVKNGALSLKNIQLSDQGVYICRAENNLHNRSFSINTTLHVLERVRFQDLWPHHYLLKPGDKFELSCAVNLKSGYTIVWEKNGKILDKNRVTNNAVSTNGRFIVHSVNVSDSGIYTCTVHAYATIRQSTKLLVAGVMFLKLDNKISVTDNSSAGKGHSSPSWSVKDQVLLGFLCVFTLSISTAATVGTMIYCHRNPHFCNQCNSICRVTESTAHCYYIQHDFNNNPTPNRPLSTESTEFILNESHDHNLGKLANACLSFTNPVFEEENELHSSIHDVHPGDHRYDIKDEVCLNINTPVTETQSLDSTCSEPYASGSDCSLNRHRQTSTQSM